jgi:hypothetical protein
MKATVPGVCYICGRPVFIDDEIVLTPAFKGGDFDRMGITSVACHVECDPDRNDQKKKVA